MTAPALLPDHLMMLGSDPDLLRDELLGVIRRAIDSHERSQQKALGPSEVGHPCARRLGYQLLDYDERPDQEPNWKAAVGTMMHTGFEEFFRADNAAHYEPDMVRWILEETLYCGQIGNQPLLGHCDLYDQVTATVVDWKTSDLRKIRKYRASGVSDQYRIQAHIYGRGWALRGYRVDRVALMFLVRDGQLRDQYFWSEPYDEQVALDAIARVEGIARTTTALGDAALPLLPTADAWCTFCPFYKKGATDLTTGCPGDPAGQVPATDDPAVQELSLTDFEGLTAFTTTP